MSSSNHVVSAADEPEGDAKAIGQRLAGELVNELLPLQPRRVLTAEGALWGSVKPELRQLLALVEGARPGDHAQLLVSGQHLRDPFVMAFMGDLDRADLASRREDLGALVGVFFVCVVCSRHLSSP